MLKAGNCWYCSLISKRPSETPAEAPGIESSLTTKSIITGQGSSSVSQLRDKLCVRQASPNLPYFPAVFGQLPPAQPPHLSSSLNRPAPFRHLPSPPPALGLAQGQATVCPRRTHSLNNCGVCLATPGQAQCRALGPEEHQALRSPPARSTEGSIIPT